jgi:molybdate transport system ATP-binding protein
MIEIAHPYTAYTGLDTSIGQVVQIGFRPESVVIIPEAGRLITTQQPVAQPISEYRR